MFHVKRWISGPMRMLARSWQMSRLSLVQDPRLTYKCIKTLRIQTPPVGFMVPIPSLGLDQGNPFLKHTNGSLGKCHHGGDEPAFRMRGGEFVRRLIHGQFISVADITVADIHTHCILHMSEQGGFYLHRI